MPTTSMWSYTWDLTYESVNDTIGRLRNDIGLEGISVATSYHSYEMLCPHRKGQKFVWEPESAVYFQPQASLYSDTPIKPHVSRTARDTDPLRAIGDACERHGLKLASWTVCLHNSYLATHYPDHAQRNAFGDVRPHALCPSSPAVQAYMVALAQDLTTNYPVQVLELETMNFDGYAQGHFHAKIGLAMGPVESLLFSLCFCSNCLIRGKRKGVDVDRLQRFVQESLDKYCEDATASTQSLTEFVAEQPDVDAFLSVRADTVSDLTRMVVAAVRIPVYYYLMGDYHVAGMRYDEVAAIADRVVILAYSSSAEQVKSQICSLRDAGVPSDRVIAGMQAYPPASPDAETLQSTVRAAKDQGVAGYCFYNYGIMPRKNLQWVKQAIAGIRS